MKILHPPVRKEPSKAILPSVRCHANILPQVITENSVDKLTDEWGFDGTSKPIYSYWENVLEMTNSYQLPKYKY